MTTTHFNGDPGSVASSTWTSIDIIAYAVHSLGFWPDQSAVLVLAGEKHLGSVLRMSIDSIPLTDQEIARLLSHYLSALPRQIQGEEPLYQFFTIIFGDGGDLRARQLNPHTFVQPVLQEIEKDAEEAQGLNSWISGSLQAAQRECIQLANVLYVGKVSRYDFSGETLDFTLRGFVEDTLKSPLYLDLLTRGSVVTHREKDAFAIHSFKALDTQEAQEAAAWRDEAQLWFDQYCRIIEQAESDYCLNFLAQKYAETALWNTAVETVQNELDKIYGRVRRRLSDAECADCIRAAIPPQLAGFLAATVTSAASVQFVLFATGESLRAVAVLMATIGEKEKRRRPTPQESPHTLDTPVALYLPMTLSGDGIFLDCMKQCSESPLPFYDHATGDEHTLSARFGKLLMGQSKRAPCWERLSVLEYIVSILLTHTDGEQRGRLLQIQAWICWFKGRSSQAYEFLLRSKKYVPFEELPLLLLLEGSILPLWVGEPEQCWRGDQRTTEN